MITRAAITTWLLHALFAALLLLLAVRTLRSPLSEFGDGREYVLQTQSIVFDQTLAVHPERRAQYFNETNPFGVTLKPDGVEVPDQEAQGEERQFGGKFGSLYLSRDGSFRYIHSWVYSLAAAPAYALLHMLTPAPGEYLAFRVLNIAALFFPLLLMWRLRPSAATLLFVAVLFASPITPHLQFAHPEVFCLGCVLASFVGIQIRWARPLSPLLLGIGAAQNVPIALFFPLHMWLMWREENILRGGMSLRAAARAFAPYGVAAIFPAAALAYNLNHFGTLNLIAQLGQADFAYLSLRKMASVFVSPMIGCLWYMPASWLALVVALAARQYRIAFFFSLSVLAVATLSSTTANINSAQLSACRYAVWYLGPLYLLPFLLPAGLPSSTRRREAIAWLAGLSLVTLVWAQLGTWRFLLGESYRFFSSQRAVPEVAALYRFSHFHDDVEPLVENVTGREIPVAHRFRGIYVWNLGKGESLWVVSQRAMATDSSLEVRSEADLAGSESLNRSFSVSRTEDSNLYRLTIRPDAQFARHPYLGGYLMLWVNSQVLGARSEAPVAIKSQLN